MHTGHRAGGARGDPRRRQPVGQVREEGAADAAGDRGHLAAL